MLCCAVLCNAFAVFLAQRSTSLDFKFLFEGTEALFESVRYSNKSRSNLFSASWPCLSTWYTCYGGEIFSASHYNQCRLHFFHTKLTFAAFLSWIVLVEGPSYNPLFTLHWITFDNMRYYWYTDQ